jgi:hypothetical protein
MRQRQFSNDCWHSRSGWKTREIGGRQGANHSQVRPRTAEQGPLLHASVRTPGEDS